jgi:hypothetical protein
LGAHRQGGRAVMPTGFVELIVMDAEEEEEE